MGKSKIAVEKFKEGYNCVRSILHSYAEDLSMSKDLALKISDGFGAGMGRKQEVCGAISGGIMILGMLYGRGENEDKQKQEKTYSKIRKFIDLFEKEYGTINCKKLLNGCELMTPEVQMRFKEENLKEKCHGYCHGYIEQAGKILEKIISE